MKLPIPQPKIVASPIPLCALADPMPGTSEYAAAQNRDRSRHTITVMPWLPQLPDQWAKDVFERIDEAERRICAPNRIDGEYEAGSATEPDEVLEVVGRGGFLFTAEHATKPITVATGNVRAPDAGTGGLVAVLAEDYGRALIMSGRQTSNVPSVEQHPLKDRMLGLLPSALGFMSLHGMASRKFIRPSDTTELQALIGLGIDPTEAEYTFAEKAVKLAHDLGLYAIIANDQDYYVQKPNDTRLKRAVDGLPYKNRMAALKPTMTTNVAKQAFKTQGIRALAVQIELTNLLRAAATDTYPKDKRSEIMGVALGYTLVSQITELALSEASAA